MLKLFKRVMGNLLGLIDPEVVQTEKIGKIDNEQKCRFVLNALITHLEIVNYKHNMALRMMKANASGDCGETIGQARSVMKIIFKIQELSNSYATHIEKGE